MTDAHATICPHCGFNLRREERITFGALDFDPYGDSAWKGRSVHLTVAERLLLGSLVAAAGQIVTLGALIERMGSEAEDSNVPAVLVCRIREKTAPGLIQNLRGHGYRLDVEYAVSARRKSVARAA